MRIGSSTRRRFQTAAVALAIVAGLASSVRATAQTVELVPLGPGSTPGTLQRPTGRASNIAFLNAPCAEMAARGFICLDIGRGEGDFLRETEWWGPLTRRFAAGIETLRRQPGVTKVVLYGHSGGATLASFYQAVAEEGEAFCQGPRKISPCRGIGKVSPADGVALFDAHPGFAAALLRNLNPSVVVEDRPPRMRVIPELDPFNPANGFNPQGESRYSEAFRTRYFAAQAVQMSRLVDQALAARKRMAAGQDLYSDDDLMVIPAGGNGSPSGASLIPLDLSLPGIFRSSRPEKLLRNDGTVVTQIVVSAATYDQRRKPDAPRRDERGSPVPDPLTRKRLNYSFEGVRLVSVNSFLDREAIRATNSLDGIDHCSATASSVCSAGAIRVPALVIAAGAYKFIGDTERLFDQLPSGDKEYVVIEGALHSFQPCVDCEKTPGQFGNSRRNAFDYLATWAKARF